MQLKNRSRKHPLTALREREVRVAFSEGHVRNGIAHQVRLLRKKRGWSQRDLASKLGSKQQSTVARIEDPSYGRLSMSTVMKLASVFDVAAQVRLVSFGKLLDDTASLTPDEMTPLSFDEELAHETSLQTDISRQSPALMLTTKWSSGDSWLSSAIDSPDVVTIVESFKQTSL